MKLTRTASYWTMAAVATLMMGLGSSVAYSQSIHICEELMRQEHTPAELQRCIDEFGEPESIREARREREREQRSRQEAAQERARYYDKSFSGSELLRFGAPYVAVQGLYRNDGRVRRVKKITKPDELCIYLGFERALDDGSLSDIMEDYQHPGFVGVEASGYIDQYGVAQTKAEQFKFNDRKPSYIQVYESITCRRERRRGDPVVQEQPVAAQPVSSDSGDNVNSTSRRSTQSGYLPANSPYLYNPDAVGQNLDLSSER